MELLEKTYPEMKVLVLLGDLFGCFSLRVDIPHKELKRYNVTTKTSAFLPSHPGRHSFQMLVEEFKNYDLVIVQRCYLRQIVETVRAVTNFLGIPLIFETDDDYL